METEKHIGIGPREVVGTVRAQRGIFLGVTKTDIRPIYQRQGRK